MILVADDEPGGLAIRMAADGYRVHRVGSALAVLDTILHHPSEIECFIWATDIPLLPGYPWTPAEVLREATCALVRQHGIATVQADGEPYDLISNRLADCMEEPCHDFNCWDQDD